jgi:hypothetical protein
MLNADTLNTETIETLKTLSRRNDDAKKKVYTFAESWVPYLFNSLDTGLLSEVAFRARQSTR